MLQALANTTEIKFAVGDLNNGDLKFFVTLETAQVAYQEFAESCANLEELTLEAEQQAENHHTEVKIYTQEDALSLSLKYHYIAKHICVYDEDGNVEFEDSEIIEGGNFDTNLSSIENL